MVWFVRSKRSARRKAAQEAAEQHSSEGGDASVENGSAGAGGLADPRPALLASRNSSHDDGVEDYDHTSLTRLFEANRRVRRGWRHVSARAPAPGLQHARAGRG